MRVWFDTEFIEDGKTIDLISIGMVREDGAEYYAETDQWIPGKASQWVKDNVIVHLQGGDAIKPRDVIAREIIEFAGWRPEFWGYYADYDWVVLCWLFGTMMQLPDSWPMYCRDIKQLCDSVGNPKLPEQGKGERHALADARWNKLAWEFLHNDSNSPAPEEAIREEWALLIAMHHLAAYENVPAEEAEQLWKDWRNPMTPGATEAAEEEIACARRVLDALLPAIAAWNRRAGGEREAWELIETAPKDGSEIILGADGWSESGFWHDGSENYWKVAGWYAEMDRGNLLTAKPSNATHWQMLPAPPRAALAGQTE